jgi:hypothetical protein
VPGARFFGSNVVITLPRSRPEARGEQAAPTMPREAKPFTRLGHESVETTQIYTHVMAKPGLGVRSPLDRA